MSNRLHLVLKEHSGESSGSISQAIKEQLTKANTKQRVETSETNLLQAIEQRSIVPTPALFVSSENEIRRCELELYEVLLELHASGIHIVRAKSVVLEPATS